MIRPPPISKLTSTLCPYTTLFRSQLRPLDITDAILASVVPAATFHLLRLVRDHFRCEPLVVGAAGVELGIEVLIDNPEEVGADRLVNAIAARQRYPGPLIIVDFGRSEERRVGKEGVRKVSYRWSPSHLTKNT